MSSTETDEIDLAAIWRLIVRHRFLAGIAFAVVFAMFVAFAIFGEPKYRATVTLIPAQTTSADGISSLIGMSGLASLAGIDPGSAEQRRREANAVMKSKSFTRSFIQENGLLTVLFEEDWDEVAGEWQVDGDAIPTINDAVDFFTKRVRYFAEHNDGTATLTIEWKDPAVAADWANRLVEKLNLETRERAIRQAQASLGFLRKELERANFNSLEQAIVGMMEAQMSNIMVANVQTEYAYRIVDPATPSDEDDYVKPKRMLLVIVGFVIACVLSLGLVLLISQITKSRSRSG